MRSKDFIEKRIQWFGLFTELSFPVFAENCMQVRHFSNCLPTIRLTNPPTKWYPISIIRYFVYGMQDAQHLERVRLEFQMFEIQKGEHRDKDKE